MPSHLPQTQQGTDGGLLSHDSSQRLCLDALLSRYVRQWAADAGSTALQYVWMLRGTADERESLAVDVLLRSGNSEVTGVTDVTDVTEATYLTSCFDRATRR